MNGYREAMRNLSIIIPFFQKQVALQKTWDELQLQLHPDDQILIIDDHSPDGVTDFDCPCTEIIRPPKRTPHIYRLNTLRNYGVEHATHDACIIIDPDCVPSPRFLDHARKIYDPSVLFAGWIWYIDKKGNTRKEKRQTGETNLGKSMWIDKKSEDCRKVLGGCMYFSKLRAKLAGLFDTEFDGYWGWEEHAFASACRNSGIRLRFEAKLMVHHQWHETNRPGNLSRNKHLLPKKMKYHRESLNYITPYNPAVAVLMVSTTHSHHIDKWMRAVFRHAFPLKVRLVNNGNQSKQHLNAMSWWNDRWAVDYIDYKTPQLLSAIRSDAIRDYSKKGYKYLVMIDEGTTPMNGSITALISEMEKNPQYHALSGYLMDSNGDKRFIGGNAENKTPTPYLGTKQTTPTGYTNLGFTIIRLNNYITSLDDVETSWDDSGWNNETTEQGLQVGVTEKAGAYYQRYRGVGVLLVTMMRPKFLEQCLSSLAKVQTPIMVYLVNQADKSKETMAVIDKWRGKISMTYKENAKLEGLAAMKRWGMEQMKADGLDYIVIVDDDVCLMPKGLEKLVVCADAHPEFHSISGWLDNGKTKRMLGGSSQITPDGTRYPRLPYTHGLRQVEWVGGGFTLHRLEPLVLHDPAYLIGLEDFDYANELKKLGLKCAVTSNAGAWHKVLINGNTITEPKTQSKYMKLRMNVKRILASKEHFKKKWGYMVI